MHEWIFFWHSKIQYMIPRTQPSITFTASLITTKWEDAGKQNLLPAVGGRKKRATVLDIPLLKYDKLILTRLNSCYLINVLLTFVYTHHKGCLAKAAVACFLLLLFSPQPHIICLLLNQQLRQDSHLARTPLKHSLFHYSLHGKLFFNLFQ